MSVNKERVQLLVDALRSGEFKQGTNALRRHIDGEVRHCCLGVATEVALRNGFQPETHVDSLWDHADQDLHSEVRDWYGFDLTDPKLSKMPLSDDPQRAANERLIVGSFFATSLNDCGFSFERIAAGFECTFINEETEA